MHNILADQWRKKIVDKERKKTEDFIKEVERLKEKKETKDERYNAESITVDALERLIRELNDNQIKRSEELAKKLKTIRWDYFNKINKKDKALKQKEHQVKTLKDTETVLSKEQEHLRESMTIKKVEIEMLKEEIYGHTYIEIENATLKRKIANLGGEIVNLEGENNKFQINTKDLEEKIKDWKSKYKIAIG